MNSPPSSKNPQQLMAELEKAEIFSSEEPTSLYQWGLYLGCIELGVGSILHTFRIPLRGQLLSLHQGVLLLWLHRQQQKAFFASEISFIASSLKALSLSGSKLIPMLAISCQGWLFDLGLLVKPNFFGECLATFLLAMWPFLQPVLIWGISLAPTLSALIMMFPQNMQNLSCYLLFGILLAITAKSFLIFYLVRKIRGKEFFERIYHKTNSTISLLPFNPTKPKRKLPTLLLTAFFTMLNAFMIYAAAKNWMLVGFAILQPLLVYLVVRVLFRISSRA